MRIYLASRRAYFPRMWPVNLLAAFIVAPLAYVTQEWWVCFPISLVAVTVRLTIWMRRHPIIPPEQQLEDRRRAAQWN